MAEPTELLTIAETAQRVRLSKRTVERLIAERRIRPVRLGRRVFVTSREVENFIAASR